MPKRIELCIMQSLPVYTGVTGYDMGRAVRPRVIMTSASLAEVGWKEGDELSIAGQKAAIHVGGGRQNEIEKQLGRDAIGLNPFMRNAISQQTGIGPEELMGCTAVFDGKRLAAVKKGGKEHSL